MGEVAVEVVRGGGVESRHRVDACVVDAMGSVVLAAGPVDAPVYPRSAVKPFQALPLVESGAAEAFGVSDEELALACASHGGEPMPAERGGPWPPRLALQDSDLACGPHPPLNAAATAAMIAAGQRPTRL